MNFTYDLTQPPDGQWGAIQPDGSWSGLVGMLMRGEIDIGNIEILDFFFNDKIGIEGPCEVIM